MVQFFLLSKWFKFLICFKRLDDLNSVNSLYRLREAFIKKEIVWSSAKGRGSLPSHYSRACTATTSWKCHCFSSRNASDASTPCLRLGTVHLKKTKKMLEMARKLIKKNKKKIDQHFYPWSFPLLLALVRVTIEKDSRWLPKATIASRLQRGLAPRSWSSAPACRRSMSDGFP